MLRATKTAFVVIALAASALTFASPAEAVTDYSSCDALHRDFPKGVAKSKKAARKQVRTGHKKPAVRAAVYRANDESDADNDGTACEVTA